MYSRLFTERWSLFGSTAEMNRKKFIIGTRGSALALWQSKMAAENLGVETQIKIVKTSGDLFQDIPLQGQNETGFFTKEIENQLIERKIDLAVHSLKDLPTRIHPNLVLAAYLPRGPVPDFLLVHPDWHASDSLIPVKEGCRVGATSLRRNALLRLYGPHAEQAILRGNVPTRIRKCREGRYGAIVLAQAGIDRLNLDVSPLHAYRLNPEIWLPAPGQGVIAVQTRKDDPDCLDAAACLDDPWTRKAAEIERQLLANFEGGCHVAFGSYARQHESVWQAFIGLDQPETGWVQAVVSHRDSESIKQIMPDDLKNLQAVEIQDRNSLCQKIQ